MIHNSIPTSYIELKLNISLHLHSTVKFDIFFDTIPIIHCTIAPTQFAILPQHPTNSIYFQNQCKLRIYTNILHWSQNQYNILVQYKKKNYTKVPILFVSCDSTPTSHIKAKFNILFGPIQIKKIATVPAWFTILYQHPTHHQPTNSIYFWIQHKQIIK